MRARRPKRGDVYLIGLDPTLGREIKKTRPCVVVSPDELNAYLQTVIIAPLTSRLGAISEHEIEQTLALLREMFEV